VFSVDGFAVKGKWLGFEVGYRVKNVWPP